MNNIQHLKFCACTGEDIDVYTYIYNLINITNKNIFKLTKLIIDKNKDKKDNFSNCHHNNLISIVSKYKIQFKEFVINNYGLNNYKKISKKIKITKFLISKYKDYIENYKFDLINRTMQRCIYLQNNIYFNKIKNNIYDCLNVRLAEVNIIDVPDFNQINKLKSKIKYKINSNINNYYKYNYFLFDENNKNLEIKQIIEKIPLYLINFFKKFITMTKKQSNKNLHNYISLLLE